MALSVSKGLSKGHLGRLIHASVVLHVATQVRHFVPGGNNQYQETLPRTHCRPCLPDNAYRHSSRSHLCRGICNICGGKTEGGSGQALVEGQKGGVGGKRFGVFEEIGSGKTMMDTPPFEGKVLDPI